jgi:hypothetical protein
MTRGWTRTALLIAGAMLAAAAPAAAQDVPGLEICTAEKTMERRTGCLQSNVNFLQQQLGRQSLAAQQKIDAANAQLAALREQIAMLRRDVDALKAVAAAKPKEPGPEKK